MKIYLRNQVQKTLQSLKSKSPQEGEIYGVKTETNLYVFSCCSKTETNYHNVTLLMPGNFERLGIFRVGSDLNFIDLQPGNAGLLLSEGEMSTFWRGSDEESDSEVQYEMLPETDLWKTFVLARVCFYEEFVCNNDETSIDNCEKNLLEVIKSSTTAFKTEKCKALLQVEAEYDSKTQRTSIGSLSKPLNKKTTIPLCTFQVTNHTSDIVEENSESIEPIVAILYLPKTMTLPKVSSSLVSALIKRLHLASYWIRKQAKDGSSQSDLRSYLIDHYLVGFVLSPMYPTDCTDEVLQEYRLAMQEALCLPMVPILRKTNVSYLFEERPSTVLMNPHESVSIPEMEDAMTCMVKGLYGYHHYMQDHFNDNKWGCAYRSLQTLISWFRLQGYTQKPIPTHSEIQQVLVDLKDKPASFVGSRQWIGSTEVGFILESYLGVSSRFITVNSGDDLADHGRALCLHFDRVGTPIMIGGGVLAHTIIGVQWSQDTGDIKYLILDPHYTGGENINNIVNKGWCGWKDQKFWKSNAYYNLCIPQLPNGA